MSLLRSIFGPGALSSYRQPDYRRTRRDSNELPRWAAEASASTFNPSFPPKPITESLYQPSGQVRLPRTFSPSADPTLLDIRRREKQLEQHLQSLLDAQAEGLIAGLEGRTDQDDHLSTGSSTPTLRTARSTYTDGAAARPPRRKPGLRSARKGIRRAIEELAAVKQEEGTLLSNDLTENEATLDHILGWERKRAGLTRTIEDIQRENISERVDELAEEAMKLEDQIMDMEARLAQMKTRHRQLVDEISGIENSVQSKLSSYKASLELLDSEVNSFLRRPPIPSDRKTEGTFLALPAQRRTLDLAKDYWEKRRTELERDRQRIETDQSALSEGAAMWESVVKMITTFEVRLQEDMQGMASKPSKGRDRASEQASRMESLMEGMDSVMSDLEDKLEIAEGKNWNLLVCCMGAELEAFRQGREILQQAFSAGTIDGVDSLSAAPAKTNGSTSSSSSPELAFRPTLTRQDSQDHDGPDPELLISHQDTDTD